MKRTKEESIDTIKDLAEKEKRELLEECLHGSHKIVGTRGTCPVCGNYIIDERR